MENCSWTEFWFFDFYFCGALLVCVCVCVCVRLSRTKKGILSSIVEPALKVTAAPHLSCFGFFYFCTELLGGSSRFCSHLFTVTLIPSVPLELHRSVLVPTAGLNSWACVCVCVCLLRSQNVSISKCWQKFLSNRFPGTNGNDFSYLFYFLWL